MATPPSLVMNPRLLEVTASSSEWGWGVSWLAKLAWPSCLHANTQWGVALHASNKAFMGSHLAASTRGGLQCTNKTCMPLLFPVMLQHPLSLMVFPSKACVCLCAACFPTANCLLQHIGSCCIAISIASSGAAFSWPKCVHIFYLSAVGCMCCSVCLALGCIAFSCHGDACLSPGFPTFIYKQGAACLSMCWFQLGASIGLPCHSITMGLHVYHQV